MSILSRSLTTLVAFVAALSSYHANAGTMLQPVSASTNISTWEPPINVINQSGMWTTYTSGVTDFDTFMAGDPAHASDGKWMTNFFVLTGNFDFDLGGSYLIGGLALWGGGDTGVGEFRLLASDDASFTNPTLIGTFHNNPPEGRPNFQPGQVFKFSAINASFVRMEILSNRGSIFNTTLSEVAFDAFPASSAVPEPSSIVMLGLGVAGAAGVTLRRRRFA